MSAESEKSLSDSDVISSQLSEFIPVPRNMYSRLLYSNPVCFLITQNSCLDSRGHNIMTISWLSCINNHGAFMMSINASRYTAEKNLQLSKIQKDGENNFAHSYFTLSPAVNGQQNILTLVGSTSGGNTDRQSFGKRRASIEIINGKLLDVEVPSIPYRKTFSSSTSSNIIPSDLNLQCVEGSPAHILCKVVKVLDIIDDHFVVHCQIVDAFVKSSYWLHNKLFVSPKGEPSLLSFVGTKEFCTMEHVK